MLTDQLPQTREAAIKWYLGLQRVFAKNPPKLMTWWNAERWLGRNDLFYLLIRILRRPDVNKDWLFARCREVQAAPDGYLDLWAREHYKSTIITFGKTIQDILNDPEMTVAIFSHTRPVAKAFLQQIKREMEDNEALKQLYPDVLWKDPAREAAKWSENEGIIVKRRGNPKESSIEAWGLVDGQPTGRHFRLRVYDDVVTRESVTTPEMVKKVTDAWDLSQNLGVKEEDGGIVRYIGTRYSLFDTYTEILKRGAAISRIYPATHNGQRSGSPVFFSEAEWQKRVSNSRSSILAAQMLQNPLADEDATFRTEWLQSYEIRPRTLNVYILCDPSRGRSSESDNTAIAVIGIARGGAKFFLDGACHRMTLSQRWVKLRDFYRKWSRAKGVQHIAVGYERYGAQSDDEYFAEQMELDSKRGIKNAYFGIAELNWPRDGTESKRERVERLEPDFRNGRFYLPLPLWAEANGKKGPVNWNVDRDPDSKTRGTIIYRAAEGLTSRQIKALAGGSSDLVATALRQTDQDARVYDVTVHLMEEYANFPFGEYKDLIDACSRIYDMDPMEPTIVKAEDTAPAAYWDS